MIIAFLIFAFVLYKVVSNKKTVSGSGVGSIGNDGGNNERPNEDGKAEQEK